MSLRVSLCLCIDRGNFLIRTKEVLEISPRGLIKRSENSGKNTGEEALNEIVGAIGDLCHGKAV